MVARVGQQQVARGGQRQRRRAGKQRVSSEAILIAKATGGPGKQAERSLGCGWGGRGNRSASTAAARNEKDGSA